MNWKGEEERRGKKRKGKEFLEEEEKEKGGGPKGSFRKERRGKKVGKHRRKLCVIYIRALGNTVF